MLSREEWRKHLAFVLNFTIPHRAVGGHSYGGYPGPWIESIFITYFMGIDTGDASRRPGRRRQLRRLLRRIASGGADADDSNNNDEERHSGISFDSATVDSIRRRLEGAQPKIDTGGVVNGDVPNPSSPEILRALEEAFYPSLPVFSRWADSAFGADRAMHPKNKELFEHAGNPAGSSLLGDALYVALSQHDRGEVASGIACRNYGNVLTFSSGGWGNVAIPLIKGTAQHMSKDGSLQSDTAWQGRPRLRMFSFVGTNHLGRNVALSRFTSSGALPAGHAPWFDSLLTPDWRSVARQSIFALAPRGYGRTSFRLFELLQYGTLPVYLYDDVAWTPYQHYADFMPPGAVVPSLTDGGPTDVRRFGAVLQVDRPAHKAGASSVNSAGVQEDDSVPFTDAQLAAFASSDRGKVGYTGPSAHAVLTSEVESGVQNNGGMWGPGGVGFAVAYSQVRAFLCIACEFLRPGSAARWRHVRVLPLHRYGTNATAQQSCPCTPDAWKAVGEVIAAAGGSGSNSNSWVVPRDSLVGEMERRLAAVGHSYFTYDGTMAHIRRFLASPLTSELVCVPKPEFYGTPLSDPPFIE